MNICELLKEAKLVANGILKVESLRIVRLELLSLVYQLEDNQDILNDVELFDILGGIKSCLRIILTTLQ